MPDRMRAGMIPLLRAEEMQALEREAIDAWGMPSCVLQEHAALGALALLPRGERLQVLAGPGNNGGDALALARLARLRGESVEVWALAAEPRWVGDAAAQAELWLGLGGTFRHAEDPTQAVASFRGWVVDGLFGLGGRPPLRGAAESWAVALNRATAAGAPFRVLALDLPSGLDPSGGDLRGEALRAHRTACFGQLKRCHGLRPARDWCGEITVVPIPLRTEPKAGLWSLEAPVLEPEAWNTHKRRRGHLAIRAGSPGMSGAAVLAALGALRLGVGLLTLLVDPELRAEIAAQVPEAMVRPWEGRVPEGIDALLVGPGGVSEVPVWDGPLVLDASALRAGEGEAWLRRPGTVLTPHEGEFNRLFGAEPGEGGTEERLSRGAMVAQGPGVLVLKGAQTLIAGGDCPELWVNSTGHPGLATGGSGDFLAGMVGAQVARWARRGSSIGALRRAVAEAVWFHGRAADRLGPGPLLVRDLGESLRLLMRELHD